MAARSAFKPHLLTPVGAFGFHENRARHGQPGLDGIIRHLNRTYRDEVNAIDPLVVRVQEEMGNAIAFVEDCFGDGREMLVFLAELSTRTTTMRFISSFGSDAYYERSNELKVDEARDNLNARVRELADIREEIQSAQFLETQALDMGGASGIGHSDSNVPTAPKQE